MANFKLKANYPALPVGYSWKSVVDRDDPSRYWVKVSLRRDVKVLGMTIHLPYASKLEAVNREYPEKVPRRVENMSYELMAEKLGLKTY